MHSRIHLNGNVIFDSHNNTLTVTSENDRIVKLNAPVSRCLLLLLEKYPEAVTQADLFQFIWGSEASQIPLNALYQNISLLRRSLKNASNGLSDMVITVPRTGFRLSSELKVSFEEADVSHLKEKANRKPSQVSMPDAFSPPLRKFLANTVYLKPMLFVAIALFSAGLFWLGFSSQKNERTIIFDSYTLATEHGGCNVFTYPDFAQNNTSELNGYFNKFNITCNVLTNAYLSVNTARTRVSVMYCDKPVLEAKTCVTKIYWNDN
ncbi:hypothetical protein FH968_10700 [Buttiauxella sp. B2]|uniref:winged helix-turn-helix domain-containing protein n=1 Tax=Buttiauxella sp. B2 TaxID=2587812 RepID=UPI0011207086|nr:winged helix-turn-helix domain-containing protein [Buttiauxella sp. B2]TNV20464.1 hypothetical protein FH968_10700 [Buttiauxella sp. B2]